MGFEPLIPRCRPSQDTVLPLATPVRGADGTELTELFVRRGQRVVIHYQASNVNKALWGADAAEWRPERWSKLPDAVVDAHIPGVYSHL